MKKTGTKIRNRKVSESEPNPNLIFWVRFPSLASLYAPPLSLSMHVCCKPDLIIDYDTTSLR